MAALRSLEPSPTGPLHIPDSSPLGGSSASRPDSVLLSLVIPTFNESRNIEELVKQLSGLLDGVLPNHYELIVVDDDSTDHTWEAALSLTPEYPHLRVIRRQGERGLATAVIRGWQVARGNILGVIDGDLQHPPEVLLGLLSAIETSAIAVATRHAVGGGVSDWSFKRRVLSRGAQLLGLVILPEVVGRISDPLSGYFLVRRSVIEGKTFNPLGYKVLIEVLARGEKRKVSEIGYVFRERQRGGSKATWKVALQYPYHLLMLRVALWPIRRFAQFCFVGLSGVFVDMAVLYLLSDPATLGWGLTRSKMVAAEFAIINNFIWNDLWTFRDVAAQQKNLGQRFKRLLKFNLVCLMGLVINVIVLNILFNIFGLNRYLANLIAIMIVTLWNFWINLKLNWRVTQIK